jgi:peroxiredoxin Q/BCP
MPLSPGDRAPEFTLQDGDGQSVSLAALRGQWVVLYFYPRDNTPGCTKEACGFRDRYPDYQSRAVAVYGISTDDAKSHTKFTAKYNLPFPLLCDPDAAMATAYESYGLKKFMGKEYMGIMRHTFIIDPDGIIQAVYRKVKPADHADQVIADLDRLMADP